MFIAFDGEESPRGTPRGEFERARPARQPGGRSRAARRPRDDPAGLRGRAGAADPAREQLRPAPVARAAGGGPAGGRGRGLPGPHARRRAGRPHPVHPPGGPRRGPHRLRLRLLPPPLRQPVANLEPQPRRRGRNRARSCSLHSEADAFQHRKSCCWRPRAATARASTGRSRRSSAPSSSTAPPVYVRKEIVHNKHVVEQLRERGAIFVEQRDRGPRGRDRGLLRPRRRAQRARQRRRAGPGDHRRHLPAGHQGARGGQEVRRRGPHRSC